MSRIDPGRLPRLIVLTVTLCLAPPLAQAQTPEEVWGSAQDTLEDLLQRRSEAEWAPIDLETGAGRRVQRLLDRAVDLLAASPASGLRQQIRDHQAQIRTLRDQVAAWRVDAVGAPPDGGMLDGLIGRVSPQSRADYQRRIDAATAEIARIEGEVGRLSTDFAGGLDRIGVHLTPDQVDGLLGMVTGDDVVAMAAVFENMRGIDQALLDATRAGGESIEAARRYYGIHAVLLAVAVRMHDHFIERVADEYLTRLDRMTAETTQLNQDTRRQLLAERDARLRDVLQHNVSAQELTLRAAEIYRTRLAAQRDQAVAARQNLRHELEVAVNTFRTVDITGSLLEMMALSARSFDALMQLRIPELRPFESQDLRREFDRLTIEMTGGT